MRPRPSLWPWGKKTRGHRQTPAQCIERGIAAIGQHRVGLAIEGVRILATRAAPPHHRHAFGQWRMQLGEQARKPACEQRLRAGQLADAGRLHQQAANRAPQRQRRHIAGPAVHEQIGAEGAHSTALGCRLKAVEHRGVGEVLRHEAPQLRGAEGLEEACQAQADHVRVIPAHHRQPGLRLLPAGVLSVEQARHRAIDHIDDVRHWHRAQMAICGIAHPVGQRLHLRTGQHRHRYLEPHAVALEGQHLPPHLVLAQARQPPCRDPLRCHAAPAFTNSSTAREQPLAAAPSARPSNRKPPSAHSPTSSVRMVETAL